MKYLLENIESERLKFRLLEHTDFETWLPIFYEPNVAKFLGLDESLSPKELCTKWFNRVFERYQNDLGGLNVLEDLKTGQFIGQCGLLVQNIQNKEYLEVGYSILPQYWGKGYATEAALKAKQVAFMNNYTNFLISVVHADNRGSEIVAKRNGMDVFLTMDDYHGIPVNIFGIHKNQ